MSYQHLTRQCAALLFCLVGFGIYAGAQSEESSNSALPATNYTLTIKLAGTSTGTVASSPAGINCPGPCTAPFASGTVVKLTAVPAKGAYFVAWSGACKGTSACTVTINNNLTATATFNVIQTVKVLNHIIFMAQENRGLDHYFGELREYWRENKFTDESFDGLAQFNPTSGIPPLYGPPPTNPGCDPNFPPPHDCAEENDSPNIASYHLITSRIRARHGMKGTWTGI